MEKLVQELIQKAGLSAENAQAAVTTVMNYMKEKLPAGIGEKVTAMLQDKDGDGDVDFGDIVSGLKDSIGGLFGK